MNGGQGLDIMFAVLAGASLPATPLQALWVNMVTMSTFFRKNLFGSR